MMDSEFRKEGLSCDNGAGSAFPTPDSAVERSGMTLRDYMAGQVLTGMVACPTIKGPMADEDYAVISYKIADAMLKARDKGDM